MEAFHSGKADVVINREDLSVGFLMASRLFHLFAEFQR
jgi:hypothetical protein